MTNASVIEKDEKEQDLHLALKSCVEIGSSKTLLSFINDVLRTSKSLFGEHSSRVFPGKYWQEYLRNKDNLEENRKTINFLKRIIVCTEGLCSQSNPTDQEIERHEEEQ